MASADFSLRPVLPTRRRPFRREARSPQVRTVTFPAQPPDLRRLSLGRESFAFMCPLALLGNASYPVSVRRLAGSLPRFFQRSPRGRRLAVRFGRYDQVPGGLSPPDHCPCWAHTRKRSRETPTPLYRLSYGSVLPLVEPPKSFSCSIPNFGMTHVAFI